MLRILDIIKPIKRKMKPIAAVLQLGLCRTCTFLTEYRIVARTIREPNRIPNSKYTVNDYSEAIRLVTDRCDWITLCTSL
jgi:hypothetical protein